MTEAFPATAPKLGLYPVVDSVLWIERLLAAVEGRVEIDLHLPVQFTRRDVGEIRHEAGPGVVHQGINAPEPRD